MPDSIPSPEHHSTDIVRRISTSKAYFSFKGRLYRVSEAFQGEPVALRPLNINGLYGVFFASHQIGTIDLTATEPVSHVSEQVSAMSPD